MASGTYAFNIDGYGLHKGLGNGRYIRSAVFAVGGYEWCIRYYPDGECAEVSEYISVSLELLTKNAEVRARYRFRLEIPSTWQSLFNGMKYFEFNSESRTSGYPKFKTWKQLEASVHVNRIVIVCDVTVIKETRVEETALAFEVPPSNLSDNLRELLVAKEGADVTFMVEEVIFPAHKIILAMRSPVFKEDLQKRRRRIIIKALQKRRPHKIIEDMRPAVFEALLHFIYTDSLPSMDDLPGNKRKKMVTDLLVAADRYAMERMKMMCAALLCKSLDVKTVAATFYLAHKHNCSQLKDACAQFIAFSNRKDDVEASKEYKDLKSSNPAVTTDMWERVNRAK